MRYLFGDCVLDTDRRELHRGPQSVAVAPQVLDLLAYLIRNRDRVVSKDDVIAAVWGGRIVSDAALTTRLNVARTAIGDSGERQRLIKTLPRKGFRFVGNVREEQPLHADVVDAPPSHALPCVAVLPFDNLGGDPKEVYFSDGITEDIITELSRFSELVVIARNSSFQYKGKSLDICQAGRELGARYVLEGSVRRAGDRIRVTAQLIDATTGAHRWAERYDRELTDVFAVQDEVASTIAAILAVRVNKAEAERALLKPPAAWQAYDYYLQAADAFASFLSSWDGAELHGVKRLLKQSLNVDPKYARAYCLLSSLHSVLWVTPLDGDYLQDEVREEAHQLARRAVQLDPNLPHAHAQLAWVLAHKGESDAAMAAMRRAIELNPNYIDYRFAAVLIQAGYAARAIEILEAYRRLDPFYPATMPGWLGFAYYMEQKYADALFPLRECVSRAPDFRFGHAWLAVNYVRLGRLEDARAETAHCLRLDPVLTIATQRRLGFFQNHFLMDLRQAGFPED